MSRHNALEAGFTIVELTISISLMAIIGVTFLVFFKGNLFNYLNLQSDATSMTQLDTQEMRVASVVRGLGDISSASSNDLVLYTYFFPSDTYESLVHYYLQTNGSVIKLLADVTPMTANPPIGTSITANKQTYTIIDTFYQPTGGTLFTYLDAGNNVLTLPIADEQTIKSIQINLATKTFNGTNQTLQLQVSLRNRKTNL